MSASFSTRPELLAPAGDWDAMRAAVANGADAVYFGLANFNARHRAHNFTVEELPAIMRYLHDHNAKGFLTFNTLIFSDELESAADYIRAIAAAGVDAVIVQDLGLVRLIRAMAPSLPVHGSTQMTLTEPRGIDFVARLGVSRVVLARELAVHDIRAIKSRTPMELEVFIHGALCVAYSGQCLTSESLGGRSANRGQCAQACRLPYALSVDGQVRDLGDRAYLLSPQDLAAYELVDELSAIGVACFKIEGRLKSAHYVAATTQTYRQAIDAFAVSRPFEISSQQRGDLEQTFSRGFTHGFLSGVNHQKLVAARFPKSRGRRVGVVERITTSGVALKVDGDAIELKPGDGIVFDEGHPEQDEQGGRVFVVRQGGKNRIDVELGRGEVNLHAIAVGAIVWKTDDPAIRKRLEHSFARDVVLKRAPLHARVRAAVGELLSLSFSVDDRTISVRSETPLTAATKHPATNEMLREQLARLGDTPFELATLDAEIVGGPMVPKSVLNDLRRRAVEILMLQRCAKHEIANDHGLIDLRGQSPSPQPSPRLLGEGEGPTPSPCTQGEGSALSIDARAVEVSMSDWRAPNDTQNDHALIDLRGQPPSPQPSPRLLGEGVKRTPSPCTQGEGGGGGSSSAINRASMHVLVRTMDQLHAAIGSTSRRAGDFIYCDFEDVRRYKDAVAICRIANAPIALATLRIVKPTEDGLLQQILDCAPDAVLVRNLAAVSFFRALAPHLPQIGDYSLNIANDLTARLFIDAGLVRMVPSYDLNWKQMAAMLARVESPRFECVIHQHMPMFHMEHCVFAHTLSTGKDFRDCGRPCERHQVDLLDRVGEAHPLVPDVGCRNTLFNAKAQSAAEYVPRMREMGINHFRIELMRETAAETIALLERYADVINGRTDPLRTMRSLRVINQLGVTRGTLDRE